MDGPTKWLLAHYDPPQNRQDFATASEEVGKQIAQDNFPSEKF